MKKRMHLYTCTLAIWLFLSGCDKGPDLTPITQEGKNTFSCKINGKVWIPKGKVNFFATINPISGGFYLGTRTDELAISISTYNDNDESISIYLKSINLGTHILSKDTYPLHISFKPENYGFYISATNMKYITSSINMGNVVLTKADTTSGIIAGTFEFTAADPKGTLVRITDGRFDIKSPL